MIFMILPISGIPSWGGVLIAWSFFHFHIENSNRSQNWE